MSGDYAFETFDSRTWYGAKRHAWRLKSARNGETLAHSETYVNRADRDDIVGKLSAASGFPVREQPHPWRPAD